MTHRVPTNLFLPLAPTFLPPVPSDLHISELEPHSSLRSSSPRTQLPELVLAPLILIVFPSRDFGLLQSTVQVQIPFSLCTLMWRSLELTLCRTKRTLTNACNGYHLPDALTVRIAAEESQCPNALDPQFSASPCFCMVTSAQSKSLH